MTVETSAEPSSPGAPHPAAMSLQQVIWLSNESERELARLLRINLTDYRAVSALATGGIRTVGDLARALGLSAATTTAIVNRLEERGHVVRARDGGDRRVVTLHLTESVIAQIRELMSPLVMRADERLRTLPTADQAAAADFLAFVVESMTDHVRGLSALPVAASTRAAGPGDAAAG